MRQLRRALLDGAMVVLPIGAIVLLVLGILRRVQDAAAPLSERVGHPVITAVLLLVLLWLVVGFLVRSTAGLAARRLLERRVFELIPGYRLAKAFTGDSPVVEHGGRALLPALAAIEEGQCPALVMDELTDGRLVVFVPGSPAPMSGSLYVFTPDKVTYLDVPLLSFMKAISSWGLGLREMIEVQAGTRPGTAADHPRFGSAPFSVTASIPDRGGATPQTTRSTAT